MRFRLSQSAFGDLDSIYRDTLERWGQEQADRYVGVIWTAFEKVVEAPDRWRLRDELYPGCRIYFCGRHAILYRVHEGRIEIARVLHDAMDFPKHIPPDFMGGS